MKLPVRPALPNTTVDNDAPLTRPSSTYKPGNVVQTSGATSALVSEVFDHVKLYLIKIRIQVVIRNPGWLKVNHKPLLSLSYCSLLVESVSSLVWNTHFFLVIIV